jgi:hypothetical protein
MTRQEVGVRHMDDEGMNLLVAGIVKQAIQDYQQAKSWLAKNDEKGALAYKRRKEGCATSKKEKAILARWRKCHQYMKEVPKFLQSEWCNTLTNLDSSVLMKMLEKE